MTPQEKADHLLAEHQANRKREQALRNYYDAERNDGTCPLVACERMGEFAKRLDAEFERDLEVIRQCIGAK